MRCEDFSPKDSPVRFPLTANLLRGLVTGRQRANIVLLVPPRPRCSRPSAGSTPLPAAESCPPTLSVPPFMIPGGGDRRRRPAHHAGAARLPAEPSRVHLHPCAEPAPSRQAGRRGDTTADWPFGHYPAGRNAGGAGSGGDRVSDFQRYSVRGGVMSGIKG